jgi:hypothetical protein
VNWRKINSNCLESDDKKWLIAKYKVRGAWVYQLTRVGSPSESVLIAETAQECKERADE